MRFTNVTALLTVIAAAGFLTAGCGSDGPSLADDMKAASGKPPPSAAQMQAGWKKIGELHAKDAQATTDWVKAHPDEAAKTNAARAKLGLPPLGG